MTPPTTPFGLNDIAAPLFWVGCALTGACVLLSVQRTRSLAKTAFAYATTAILAGAISLFAMIVLWFCLALLSPAQNYLPACLAGWVLTGLLPAMYCWRKSFSAEAYGNSILGSKIIEKQLLDAEENQTTAPEESTPQKDTTPTTNQ